MFPCIEHEKRYSIAMRISIRDVIVNAAVQQHFPGYIRKIGAKSNIKKVAGEGVEKRPGIAIV